MIKIVKVKIERFRSINSLEMEIDQESNIIAICGKNNVGKTNALRAINVFFNPEQYDKSVDMTTLKKATGGGTTHPKITVTFRDDKTNYYYEIVRDINSYEKNEKDLTCSRYEMRKNGVRKINSVKVEKREEIQSILNKFDFTYIESINVILPELINDITDDVIDAEYDKVKFSNRKKQLKDSYDEYIDGLTDILNSFAADISATFKDFQPAWSVKFNVPKNSDSFRELISNDVSLQLDDSGSIGIEDKGAGLQRLAAILLQFELLSRKRKNRTNIVCIDEPDVYIHEGLQRKLKEFLDSKTGSSQIFLTTHSKVFLDQYRMKNVFLFEAKHRLQYSERKKRNINVVETYLVDINSDDGYKKICEHLGVEVQVFEPLKKHNLIVEGCCDVKYLSELGKFFGLKLPYIISLDGANNAERYLDFYDSFYKDSEEKPVVKILLDNDEKGREVFASIKEDKYKHIIVKKVILSNFNRTQYSKNEKYVNNEIEDLMYPEIMVHLINNILSKKGLKEISTEIVCEKIKSPAFIKKGILNLCENEKNNENLELGNSIVFYPASDTGFKKSMAELFSLEANISLINLVRECNDRNPEVRKFLEELMDFSNL